MYDEMNEAHEFVGESRQEAVGKATAYFGVGEDELVIGELPPGEVYGLGGRAVIVALRKDRTPPAPGGGGGGGRRERERDRDSRGGRGDRGRGRDRERGGRDRGDRGDRGGRGERAERGGRDRGDRGDRMAPDTRELSDEPSVGTPLGTLGEVGTFLLGVIERLELGPFEAAVRSCHNSMPISGFRALSGVAPYSGRCASQAAVTVFSDTPSALAISARLSPSSLAVT